MGFFDKIKAGLTKTREALSGTLGSVFSGFSEIDDDFYDELEESLILADLGVDTSVKAVGRLRKAVRVQPVGLHQNVGDTGSLKQHATVRYDNQDLLHVLKSTFITK